MEQIGMIVVLAVVIVAIVGVVVLTGDSGEETPQTTSPASPDSGEDGSDGGETIPIDTDTGDSDEGTSDSTDDSAPSAGVDFGTPTECVAQVTTNGETQTWNYKVEGSKMKAVGDTATGEVTILSPDGNTYYVHDSGSDSWIKVTDAQEYGAYNPNELQASYKDQDTTGAIDCNNVADIPDSEFEPPADAEVTDMDAMMEDLEGVQEDYNF